MRLDGLKEALPSFFLAKNSATCKSNFQAK